jgi:hypothetical protein
MEPLNSDEKKNFSLLITTSDVTNKDELIAALEKDSKNPLMQDVKIDLWGSF